MKTSAGEVRFGQERRSSKVRERSKETGTKKVS